jgi:hypothetical protein
MTTARPRLTLLGRTFLVVALLLIGIGTLWYGFSADTHQRLWRDIFDRAGGPMSFRFILQPTMAVIAAIADGVTDARLGRTPYLWTILHEPGKRAARLNEGLNATARVLLLGIGMDAIYQYRVFQTFYPSESVVTAVLLAFIPYLLLRGPITRVARWWMSHHQTARAHKPGARG